MRRFFTLVACATLLGMSSLQAQQIRGDFDVQTEWGPETALGSTFKGIGIEPAGWSALNVTQMGMKFPLVFESEGRNGSGKSIKLMNRKLGAFGIGANSPSYITLGKTWVYADIMGVMSQLGGGDDPDDSDGGSIGGIDFTFRPDSIVGYYKRVHAEQNPNEVAQIIVYSWIGTCKSYSPVGDGMDATENLPKEALVERDVDILGVKNNNKPASGITLIAKQIYSIEGNIIDWTRVSVPIDYLRNENPRRMNVIITSADYFNRPNIGAENTLYADDVRFIYNSKLKSIKIGGVELDSFDEDVMEYVVAAADVNKEVVATAYGKNAKVTVNSVADGKRTITVTDETAKGQKNYTYTIVYKGAPAAITINAPETEKCIYGESFDLASIFTSANKDSECTYESTNPSVASIKEGKLVLTGVGSAQIIARQGAIGNYSPSVSDPLNITVKKAPLTIGVKDITRVYNYTDDKFEFVYTGLKNDDANQVDKVFTTKPTAFIPNQTLPSGTQLTSSKGVYVGEYAITVSGAEAPNYEITYATGAKLTVTKAKADIKISTKDVTLRVGDAMPDAFTVNYAGLIGYDKLDKEKLFTTAPIASTTGTTNAVGEFDITLSEGVWKDKVLSNYDGNVTYTGAKLIVKAKLNTPNIDDVIGDIEGLPKNTYAYAGQTDYLDTIIVKDKSGNILNETGKIEFKVEGTNAGSIFFIENTKNQGAFRLWGNNTGEVIVKLILKETETDAAVEKVIATVNVTKIPVTVKPENIVLDDTFNSDDPVTYVQSDPAFELGDKYKYGMKFLFTICPTLTIEAPEGNFDLVYVEKEVSGYSTKGFDDEGLAKLYALPVGKYNFTIKGGQSNLFECTYDNTKGTILVADKNKVTIAEAENLMYGQDPFALTVSANGKTITEYAVEGDCVEKTSDGKYKILTPGEITVTFDIPAGELTFAEEGHVERIEIRKAVLTVTPSDITSEEGNVVIPFNYGYSITGYVNGDDRSVIAVAPYVVCDATEDAKAGDVFAIIVTGGESDLYDFVYNEGKFSVINPSGIEVQVVDDVRIYAADGTIYVKGNEDLVPVQVYTIQGSLVYNGNESVITGLERNKLYIVKVGSAVVKVLN